MKASTWIGMFGCLIALAFLGNTEFACAHDYSRGCAWPLELSPEGSGNVQGPDSAARYWIMPFDSQTQKMTIKGTYPNIRFFSFAAYETIDYDPVKNTNNGFNLVEHHLYDAQIAPDKGSSNPFVPPGGRNGTYTVTISRTGTSSGNTIAVSADLVWVVMRMYVANQDPSLSGKALMGGVPLPTITVTDQTGASKQLDTCFPINNWSDMSAFAQFLFPPDTALDVDEGTPATDRLWFASPLNPPSVLWPNPDGKYLMMWPGEQYQPGRLMVIRGKAPGFPGTFNGSPIWVPSRGFRSVDVRYWAACEQEFALPLSLIDCVTDMSARLEGGYYTIVITDDRQRPSWLSPNVNWLPYGDEQYPKFVVVRNMVPSDDFPYAIQNAWEAGCTFDFSLSSLPDRTALDAQGPCAKKVMGDYYPDAVWCDKSTFMHGGWQACFKGR
ncbi:MAG TPA: hypothetical protein VJ550_07300 [Geomonas sp.]|nr:hypothetical protein [Geomonas sp.]